MTKFPIGSEISALGRDVGGAHRSLSLTARLSGVLALALLGAVSCGLLALDVGGEFGWGAQARLAPIVYLRAEPPHALSRRNPPCPQFDLAGFPHRRCFAHDDDLAGRRA